MPPNPRRPHNPPLPPPTLPLRPAGQDFKTVMAALKSNNERWGIRDVTLVLQRPQPQQ